MNIVVLVKQVPDSGAERTLSSSDNTVERGSASNVINEMDEYAIEEALKIKEAHGGEVTVLTMGPEGAPTRRSTSPTPRCTAPVPCRPPRSWRPRWAR